MKKIIEKLEKEMFTCSNCGHTHFYTLPFDEYRDKMGKNKCTACKTELKNVHPKLNGVSVETYPSAWNQGLKKAIEIIEEAEDEPDPNIKTPEFELLTEGYYPPENKVGERL